MERAHHQYLPAHQPGRRPYYSDFRRRQPGRPWQSQISARLAATGLFGFCPCPDSQKSADFSLRSRSCHCPRGSGQRSWRTCRRRYQLRGAVFPQTAAIAGFDRPSVWWGQRQGICRAGHRLWRKDCHLRRNDGQYYWTRTLPEMRNRQDLVRWKNPHVFHHGRSRFGDWRHFNLDWSLSYAKRRHRYQ